MKEKDGGTSNDLSGSRLLLVSRADRRESVFPVRVRPVTAANTPCNAASVTKALPKRYSVELEGRKS